MTNLKINTVDIKRVNCLSNAEKDLVVVEEPLEIRLQHGSGGNRREFGLSVTMRTPGNDFELAIGFLFTEGIIRSYEDVLGIRYCETVKAEEAGNVVKIMLQEHVEVNEAQLQRHFYTSSSCGVCGKSSINSLQAVCGPEQVSSTLCFSQEQIIGFPGKVTGEQLVYRHTGGIHAACLIDENGEMVYTREDIGRHNAVDKVIGAALMDGRLPLNDYLLLVSGRAGYELVQKAVVAGISMFAAVGAPSNLAVNLAKTYDMTLIGFLREGRFNIYHGDKRVTGMN